MTDNLSATLTPDDGEEYYNSALHWVRHVAGMHYIGDAFEPAHMRQLSNFATAVLRGEPVADWHKAIEKAEVWAKEMMEYFDQEEDDDERATVT